MGVDTIVCISGTWCQNVVELLFTAGVYPLSHQPSQSFPFKEFFTISETYVKDCLGT